MYLQFGKLDGLQPDGVDFPGIGLQLGPLLSRTEPEIKRKIVDLLETKSGLSLRNITSIYKKDLVAISISSNLLGINANFCWSFETSI